MLKSFQSQPTVGQGHYGMTVSVYLSVRLSVCAVPRANSRTERKPKIGRMEAHHTGNT